MTIYWFFWFLISLGTVLANNRLFFRVVFLFFIILMFLFVGFRYEIGVDRDDYQIIYDYFNNVSLSESIFYTDPGYSLFNYLGNYLGFSEVVFVNVICASIFFISFYYFSKSFKYYWVPLFVSYTYLIVVVSMNYVRQSVSIPLIMLAIYFLLKLKNFYFILFVLLAGLFHKTALVFFIFYPLFYFVKYDLNKIYYYLYIFFSILFLTVVLYYSSVSSDNIYLSDTELSSAGAIFRIMHHTLAVYIYIYYRPYFKKMFSRSLIYLDFLCILILYCLILSLFYSTMADRFNLYLILFDIIIYTVFLEKLNVRGRSFLFLVLFFMFTTSFYLWFNYGNWADYGWLPYQNYLFRSLNEIF